MSAQSYVVDASVAAKWILQEPGRDQALAFLDGYRRGRFRLFAPQLLVSEIGNVLWKKVQRQELSAPKSEKAFSLLLTNCPVLLDPESVSASALGLATAHRRTYYDSLYLALALALGCELLTADKRLYNALERVFPATLVLTAQPD